MFLSLIHSAKDSFNKPSLRTLAWTSLGVLTGGFKPGTDPRWLMPGGRPANGATCACAWPLKSPTDAVGAIPHLPLTQPPTSWPRPCFADGDADDCDARPERMEIDDESLTERNVAELALTSTMLASARDDGRVLAGSKAREERGEKPRPVVKIWVDVLFLGIWMSIPEIDTRLS